MFLRRAILLGAAGLPAACASGEPDPPPPDLSWMVGEWREGHGDQFVITSVNRDYESATGTWRGQPVQIVLTQISMRFFTANGGSVQLRPISTNAMLGTEDVPPWQGRRSYSRTLSLSRIGPVRAG
ncbi:hypothetical protein [Roseococcus sp. YIM B11640]|uniref:hypothetical protein n=1 Tax=Roseococcus sp. YIM B11640 TaxID=3133973 RepID=UPI003C7A837C